MRFFQFYFGLMLVLVSLNSNAALQSGTVLVFDDSELICAIGGVYPDCDLFETQIDPAGSWYGVDLPNDGVINSSDRSLLTKGLSGGLVLGETQTFGQIDQPVQFLGLESSHIITTSVTVVNDLGLTKELDFSGWKYDRGGLIFELGGNASMGDTGLATITCETIECANGERFSLSYIAHLPSDFESGYNDMLYELNMVGTISAVPVPAAVWLFVSGLIGLFGFIKRK